MNAQCCLIFHAQLRRYQKTSPIIEANETKICVIRKSPAMCAQGLKTMRAKSDNVNHVLPGEDGGDTSWFSRQNSFEQQEVVRQVAFKNNHWPDLENGSFSKRPEYTYPHILPDGNIKKVYYEPIADRDLQYLQEKDIALHTESLNLKSSQVACLNFLFPLRLDLPFAARVLRPLMPELDKITEIEFEYTGPIEATKWLGEPLSGKRGQHRTSIDAAIFWRDGNQMRWATLLEWKYTERNFGVCSAFSNSNKKEKEICRSLNTAKEIDPAIHCQLTNGERHRSRRYWEHFEKAGVSLQKFVDVHGCPFQGPLYQLMRQFLLGTFLIESKIVDRFDVVSMDFAKNTSLQKIPKHLQPMIHNNTNDIVDLWNLALCTDDKMRHITVEELMEQVDIVGDLDTNWRNYITERYGV